MILSLDPSLSSTGYAVLEDNNFTLIKKGKICTSNKYSTDDRIEMIIKELDEIAPNISIVILEDGYIGVNKGTSMMLAQLRGALIHHFKSSNHKVIHRMPKEIRKNFGLPGNAKKEEVAKKVLEYYPDLEQEIGPYSDKNNKKKTSDIYDAISIGLSYILNIRELL